MDEHLMSLGLIFPWGCVVSECTVEYWVTWQLQWQH